MPGVLGPLFARHDPPTSEKAAERIEPRLGKAQEVALAWVRNHPGLTAVELGGLAALRYGVDKESMRQRIGRRLNELETAGLIRREGERDGCACWYPVKRT